MDILEERANTDEYSIPVCLLRVEIFTPNTFTCNLTKTVFFSKNNDPNVFINTWLLGILGILVSLRILHLFSFFGFFDFKLLILFFFAVLTNESRLNVRNDTTTSNSSLDEGI